jgi:hypothetical protein
MADPVNNNAVDEAVDVVQGPVPFARNPSQLTNGILNYATSEGVKLYNRNTSRLYPEGFNAEPETCRVFLGYIVWRANEASWFGSVLEVPLDLLVPDETLNLVTQHAMIPLSAIKAHAETYIDGENRAAQDSHQIYQCVMNTLTPAGFSKIMDKTEDYMVHGIPSGPCLLKVIISTAIVDTNASVRMLRGVLSNLDMHMKLCRSNIVEFNALVQSTRAQLRAHGFESSELLENLFKGYKSATDKNFREYIERKEEQSDEGERLTPKALMELAETKFKVRSEASLWNAPDPVEEKIIALSAELLAFQAMDPEKEKKPAARANKKKKGGEKPAWMLVPPGEGEPLLKWVSGKDFTWCTTHNAWGRHTQAKCEGLGVRQSPPRQPPSSGASTPANPSRQLRIMQALQAVLNEDDESE